jgi:hypothetical protein
LYLPNQTQEGDAPFNMAMLFYFRLNELLSAKDKASIMGDLNAYYACLRSVFNNVYFHIRTDKNTENIRVKLDKVQNWLSGSLPKDPNVRLQAQSISFWESRKLLDEIDRELIILLDKKKMIFPRIEATQGMDAVRKKLGLDK